MKTKGWLRRIYLHLEGVFVNRQRGLQQMSLVENAERILQLLRDRNFFRFVASI